MPGCEAALGALRTGRRCPAGLGVLRNTVTSPEGVTAALCHSGTSRGPNWAEREPGQGPKDRVLAGQGASHLGSLPRLLDIQSGAAAAGPRLTAPLLTSASRGVRELRSEGLPLCRRHLNSLPGRADKGNAQQSSPL